MAKATNFWRNMEDLYTRKKHTRLQIQELKQKYSQQELKLKSHNILLQLEQHEAFKNAKTVMAYWSMPGEVYTHDAVIKWSKNKNMLLPCVKGDELEIRSFTGEEEIEIRGKYRIGEPTGPIFEDFEKIDLIVVPGVAFDQQNNRLGRGKAYYDKFLPKTRAYKIAVCFDFQMIETVPTGSTDIQMDHVIAG